MLETPKEILMHEASEDACAAFIDWRKALKKPLTARAAALIAKTLRDITAQGGDADDALDLAQEHGWQTIKADWYWKQRPRQMKVINGGTHEQPYRLEAGQRPDAALEQIARIARSR